MFFQINPNPGFAFFLDLLGGLTGLFYCAISSLLVLRGFVLKHPVSLRQIDVVGWAGLSSCVVSLLLFFSHSMPLNLWSALNFLCDLTFLLYFRSRKMPRAAVYALYIQSGIYLVFLLRMVSHMQMRLHPGFVIFQLIPACLLAGVSLVVLVQSIRERKEPTCPPCASSAPPPGTSPWPEETLEEEESPERIAQWDNQAPPESPEDDPFEELLPTDPSDPSSHS